MTIGATIACVPSFYRFLIRMGMLAGNPAEAVERPKTQPSVARGLTAEEVQRVLGVIPDDVPGRRDRALVLAYLGSAWVLTEWTSSCQRTDRRRRRLISYERAQLGSSAN